MRFKVGDSLIFLSFLFRWVLPLTYIVILEYYSSGWTQFWLFVVGMSLFLMYMWFTTPEPKGGYDDDPSGNSNVGRKFTDIM